MPRRYRSIDKHGGDERIDYDDRRNRADLNSSYRNHHDDRPKRRDTSYSGDEKSFKKSKKSRHKNKKSSHKIRRESRREKKDESKQYDELSSDDSITATPVRKHVSPDRSHNRNTTRKDRSNEGKSRNKLKERDVSKSNQKASRTPSPPIPPSSKTSYVPRAYRNVSRSPKHKQYRQQDSYDSDRSTSYRHCRRSYKRSRRSSPSRKVTRSTVGYATSLAAELIKKNESTERLQRRINERNTMNSSQIDLTIDLTDDASPTGNTPPQSDKISNDNPDSVNNVINSNTPSQYTPLNQTSQNEMTPKRLLFLLYIYI